MADSDAERLIRILATALTAEPVSVAIALEEIAGELGALQPPDPAAGALAGISDSR